MTKNWTCPKCGRKFVKKNQVHSCAIYPLEKHFQNKGPEAAKLYADFKKAVKKNVGPFKVLSLPCCIHFDKVSTFAGIFILRGKIKLHFSLMQKIDSQRIEKWSKMSSTRYLYSVTLEDKKEIDKELIGWLKQAYAIK